MYYNVIKHSEHLKTLEKCRKHSPAACVFYISLMFSNARSVLSQCNTRLRLLYLVTQAVYLIKYFVFILVNKNKSEALEPRLVHSCRSLSLFLQRIGVFLLPLDGTLVCCRSLPLNLLGSPTIH